VLDRVRLRARRRAAWLQALWQKEGAPGDARAIAHTEIATHLDGRDAPVAEAAWIASEERAAAWNHELAQIEAAMAADDTSRFALLHQIFGLGPQDSDILQMCLALAVDPALARVYGYLQDHAGRSYATEMLAARLFGYGRCILWSPESPLRRWELVHEREVVPGEPPTLTCDRQVRDWLLGENDLDEHLVGIASIRPPLPPLASWPVQRTADLLARAVNAEGTTRVRLVVAGPPGSGRRTFAACVASELGLPLLAIDCGAIPDQAWHRVFVRVQRQAYLDRCALTWYGERATLRAWPQVVPPFPVQFVVCEKRETVPAVPEVVDHRVEMPALSLDERRTLWRQYVPSSAAWDAGALEGLVARHQVTVGVVAAVAGRGVGGPEQASALVRETQRHQLGEMAQSLECPFTWDDLVVPEDLYQALGDLVYEARERAAFWERPEARRLFPQGRGLVGLFSGPPGTGKTMAAQVIAASLSLDLFRIDLSSVVSKYVGETSQNLDRILSRAEGMDVVLFFDEADALFGKRTEIKDAHDRFANTDTNFLLQALENYGGIALLATNKKANIDPAFIRRIRYVLEFPRPDAAQRLRIWQQILQELAGPDCLSKMDGDLEVLANGVEMTGAQIKFAILAGLLAARRAGEPLATPHLLRGLDRELIKEGRALSDRERERLLKNGR
jgi:AAA+ superfamily predicted ATPase